MVSRDGGKTWSICGSPVEEHPFGPYFGKSEQEMMVVSAMRDTSSRGMAESWTRVAPFSPTLPMRGASQDQRTCPPTSSRHWRGCLWYFGWDSEKNILYESLFGGDVWKLQLSSMPAAGSRKEPKGNSPAQPPDPHH